MDDEVSFDDDSLRVLNLSEPATIRSFTSVWMDDAPSRESSLMFPLRTFRSTDRLTEAAPSATCPARSEASAERGQCSADVLDSLERDALMRLGRRTDDPSSSLSSFTSHSAGGLSTISAEVVGHLPLEGSAFMAPAAAVAPTADCNTVEKPRASATAAAAVAAASVREGVAFPTPPVVPRCPAGSSDAALTGSAFMA
eukprot:CAMPEP_0176236398 /NCGR_PEP_ID=MMETSP0121_2-20121125/27323_1 /TAXON_ID=160619 /ORGANISM="Kryptoperidinium foliaceum, Strain CCMP 1326" /LENGTH=197 /DNA_ID=CAMNT_0017575829 /DNA_START=212 /DNA_END=802 /DNA_ORIENTATION=+